MCICAATQSRRTAQNSPVYVTPQLRRAKGEGPKGATRNSQPTRNSHSRTLQATLPLPAWGICHMPNPSSHRAPAQSRARTPRVPQTSHTPYSAPPHLPSSGVRRPVWALGLGLGGLRLRPSPSQTSNQSPKAEGSEGVRVRRPT